ncbi:ATP-binding protein [Shewanella yunxiaonensis]|uniref:ATP-binding protein n=1 Tax=Shewanella yunxiaonensis TaxID=2829809 RepID=A0ABX7YU68_9GAMM|nr:MULTISPECIES: ATP-binding protein [Shewanella]MDF0535010.1 ATP-binding protein [Shewanella sp. A32]QUN05666.1 ATP-binding protein [Shewanella yunxiaonensis]
MAGEQLLLPSQEALLHRLQHLACYGEQLVLLAGSQGAGKTVILTALANELEDYNLALVACPQYASAAEIRRKIVMQLLPDPLFDDDTSLVDTLLRFTPKLLKPIHILLDDADNLPLAVWAECLMLTQVICGGAAVTLTLTAKPEFVGQLLQQLPQQQRQWLLQLGIEPLSMAEREGLYQTLLTRSRQKTFTPRSIVVNQLEQQSGTPAEVLQLLDLALHGEAETPKEFPWRKLIQTALVVLPILAMGVWYMGKMRVPLPKQALPSLAITASSTLSLPEFLLDWLPPTLRPAATIAATSVGQWPWLAEVNTRVNVDETPSAAVSELLQDAAATADVTTAEVVTSDAATVEVTSVAHVASDSAAPISESSAASAVIAANVPSQKIETAAIAAALVLTLPTDGYTLQITSMKQQQSVAGQLSVLPKNEPFWLCRSGQWWVVLLGHFSTYKQAQQAAAKWQHQHGAAPWIRAWKDIQNYQPQAQP